MTEIINSVPAGLSQFLNWKVWLAAVVYIFAVLAFTVVSGALMGGENASGKRVGLGCLFYMLGGALWQGVLMALFVALFFLPLLGVDQLLPPEVLVSTLPQVLLAGAIAAVAIMIAGVLPIVGQLVANSPGIQTFLMGVITFHVYIGGRRGIEAVLGRTIPETAIPDNWQLLGYVLIAGVLTWLLQMVSGFLVVGVLARLRWFSWDEMANVRAWGMLLGPGLSLLGGVIVLFMYTGFIRRAIFGF